MTTSRLAFASLLGAAVKAVKLGVTRVGLVLGGFSDGGEDVSSRHGVVRVLQRGLQRVHEAPLGGVKGPVRHTGIDGHDCQNYQGTGNTLIWQ